MCLSRQSGKHQQRPTKLHLDAAVLKGRRQSRDGMPQARGPLLLSSDPRHFTLLLRQRAFTCP